MLFRSLAMGARMDFHLNKSNQTSTYSYAFSSSSTVTAPNISIFGMNSDGINPDVFISMQGIKQVVWRTTAQGAPSTGTWAVGDQAWKSDPAAGSAPGWICTTAGTPGTWKAMAVLAS